MLIAALSVINDAGMGMKKWQWNNILDWNKN
jgi:hypothetical protein